MTIGGNYKIFAQDGSATTSNKLDKPGLRHSRTTQRLIAPSLPPFLPHPPLPPSCSSCNDQTLSSLKAETILLSIAAPSNVNETP